MDSTSQADSVDYSVGFYARQPVFDAKGEVWAYSVYFRDGLEAALPPEARQAGATHAVLAAILGEAGNAAGQRLIIKFPAQSLIYELPLMFPKDMLVVEVHEDLAGDLQALDALRRLKAKGYLVAVGRFSAKPEACVLHDLADVLWVDALGADEEDLLRLAAACQSHPALPGLVRVEEPCVYGRGKALGFRLFQGYYFQQPETVCRRKLSSSQLSRLKLLQAIEQDDPNLKALAETIRTDVALSYKLFALLNSAHFSFPSPIASVTQALALLGWEPLRTWIRLIILTDLTPAGKSSELPRSATLRGRFLELLAKGPGRPAPETLFLAGLFSLLPAMLDQPMEQILEGLQLPAAARAALLGEAVPCAQWLALAVAFEHADWAGVQAGLVALGLAPAEVAAAYAQAREWTDTLFGSVPA